MTNKVSKEAPDVQPRTTPLSVIITSISTFLLVLGLVWNQATWQATTTVAMEHSNQTQVEILKTTEENGKLIKLNTIRLSEVENLLGKSVKREDLYRWLLSLKENNPEIKVPMPLSKSK